MPPPTAKCLVCDGTIKGAEGRDIFEKSMFGLQPLKERLQVVLQVNLDKHSSHSCSLCMACVRQLDQIDDYQCNIEGFGDTFRDATPSRQVAPLSAATTPQCFVCNLDIKGAHHSNPDDTKALKIRLERVLSVSLDEELTTYQRQLELCRQCFEKLDKVETELKVVTDFASQYRSTRLLYVDDVDQDLTEPVYDDEAEEGEGDFNDSLISHTTSEPYQRRPWRRAQSNADIAVSSADVDVAENYIEKIGKSFCCQVCGYYNHRLCHMRTHVRRHTGIKPFSCQGCGRAFADRSNCIKHTRRCNSNKTSTQIDMNGVSVSAEEYLPETIVIPDMPQSELADQVVDITGDENGASFSHRAEAENLEASSSGSKVRKRTASSVDGNEYECSLCVASFSTVQAANAHMRIHKRRKPSSAESSASDSGVSSKGNTTDSTSPCSLAPDMNQYSYEDRDLTSTEPQPKRRRSSMPDYKCRSDSLVRHLSGLNFICTVCKYTSFYQRTIAHARIHTGEKPLVCDICQKAYSDPSNFNKHRKRHRLAGEISVLQKKIPDPDGVESSEPIVLDSSSGGSDEESEPHVTVIKQKPFQCSLCTNSFDDPSLLTEHIRGHIEETEKVNSSQQKPEDRFSEISSFINPLNQQRSETSYSVRQNLNVATSHMHIPSQLGLNTVHSTPQIFEKQSQQQDGNGLVQQNVTSDNRRSSLDDHPEAGIYSGGQSSSPIDVDDLDGSDTIHDTDAMTEAYANISDTQPHGQYQEDVDPTSVSQEVRDALIHWDGATSMYKCVKCTYENSVLYNLRKHIRTHTGEKPFRCDFCPRRFADKSNQRKHERKHHVLGDLPLNAVPDEVSSVANEPKPFKCDICSVSFRYEGTLKKHRELHVENQIFTCSLCTKKFSSLFDLQKHESTAHAPRPDLGQVGKQTLVELAKKCNSNNAFRCTECGASFTSYADLGRHYNADHNTRCTLPQTLPNNAHSVSSMANSNRQYRDQPITTTQHSGGTSVIDLTDEDVSSKCSKDAFQSTIEQLDSGIYRCVLCCKEESFQLIDMFKHLKAKHDEAELVVYENMVNSGRISMIVNLEEGYRCKICPFKSYFISKMYHHIKRQHFVDLKWSEAALNEDNVEKSLIMKKNPMSYYFECRFCRVRHKAPKMLAKHVKNKHPREYFRAQKSGLPNADQTHANSARNTRQLENSDQGNSGHYSQTKQVLTPPHSQSRFDEQVQAPRLDDRDAFTTEKQGFLKGCGQKSDLPYRCGMCSHMFEEPGDLQVHFGDHWPGQVYPFTSTLEQQVLHQGVKHFFPCGLCGATYIKPENLRRHLDNHALNIIPVLPKSAGATLAQMDMNPDIKTGRGLSCPACSACFLDPHQFINHMENHRKVNLPTPQGLYPQPFNSVQSQPLQLSPYASPQMPPGQGQPMSTNPFHTEPRAVDKQISIFPGTEMNLVNRKQSMVPVPKSKPRDGSTMRLPVILNDLSTSSNSDYASMNQNNERLNPETFSVTDEERLSDYSQFNRLPVLHVEPITISPIEDSSEVDASTERPPQEQYKPMSAHIDMVIERETQPKDTNENCINLTEEDSSAAQQMYRSDALPVGSAEGSSYLDGKLQESVCRVVQCRKPADGETPGDQDSDTLTCESGQEAAFSESEEYLSGQLNTCSDKEDLPVMKQQGYKTDVFAKWQFEMEATCRSETLTSKKWKEMCNDGQMQSIEDGAMKSDTESCHIEAERQDGPESKDVTTPNMAASDEMHDICSDHNKDPYQSEAQNRIHNITDDQENTFTPTKCETLVQMAVLQTEDNHVEECKNAMTQKTNHGVLDGYNSNREEHLKTSDEKRESLNEEVTLTEKPTTLEKYQTEEEDTQLNEVYTGPTSPHNDATSAGMETPDCVDRLPDRSLLQDACDIVTNDIRGAAVTSRDIVQYKNEADTLLTHVEKGSRGGSVSEDAMSDFGGDDSEYDLDTTKLDSDIKESNGNESVGVDATFNAIAEDTQGGNDSEYDLDATKLDTDSNRNESVRGEATFNALVEDTQGVLTDSKVDTFVNHNEEDNGAIFDVEMDDSNHDIGKTKLHARLEDSNRGKSVDVDVTFDAGAEDVQWVLAETSGGTLVTNSVDRNREKDDATVVARMEDSNFEFSQTNLDAHNEDSNGGNSMDVDAVKSVNKDAMCSTGVEDSKSVSDEKRGDTLVTQSTDSYRVEDYAVYDAGVDSEYELDQTKSDTYNKDNSQMEAVDVNATSSTGAEGNQSDLEQNKENTLLIHNEDSNREEAISDDSKLDSGAEDSEQYKSDQTTLGTSVIGDENKMKENTADLLQVDDKTEISQSDVGQTQVETSPTHNEASHRNVGVNVDDSSDCAMEDSQSQLDSLAGLDVSSKALLGDAILIDGEDEKFSFGSAANPSTESLNHSTEIVYPSTESLNHSTEIVYPSSEAVNLSTEIVYPSTEAIKLAPERVNPSTEAVNLAPETVNPSTEAFKLAPERVNPSSEEVNPSLGVISHSTETANPFTEVVNPSTEAVHLSTEDTERESFECSPQMEVTEYAMNATFTQHSEVTSTEPAVSAHKGSGAADDEHAHSAMSLEPCTLSPTLSPSSTHSQTTSCDTTNTQHLSDKKIPLPQDELQTTFPDTTEAAPCTLAVTAMLSGANAVQNAAEQDISAWQDISGEATDCTVTNSSRVEGLSVDCCSSPDDVKLHPKSAGHEMLAVTTGGESSITVFDDVRKCHRTVNVPAALETVRHDLTKDGSGISTDTRKTSDNYTSQNTTLVSTKADGFSVLANKETEGGLVRQGAAEAGPAFSAGDTYGSVSFATAPLICERSEDHPETSREGSSSPSEGRTVRDECQMESIINCHSWGKGQVELSKGLPIPTNDHDVAAHSISPNRNTFHRFSMTQESVERICSTELVSRIESDQMSEKHFTSGASTHDLPTSTECIKDTKIPESNYQKESIRCSLCGDEFRRKAEYLQHLLSHKTIKCPLCTYSFDTVNQLYVHFDEIH